MTRLYLAIARWATRRAGVAPLDAHICQNCGAPVGQHGWHVAARVHDVCPGDALIEKGKA